MTEGRNEAAEAKEQEAILMNARSYEALRDLKKTNAALFEMMDCVNAGRGEGWQGDGSQPRNRSSVGNQGSNGGGTRQRSYGGSGSQGRSYGSGSRSSGSSGSRSPRPRSDGNS